MLISGVVPREIEQRTVPRVRGVRDPGTDAPAQLVEELQLALSVIGRSDSLVPPLDKPLSLRERSGLLRVVGRRHEEHLGVDVFGAQLAALDLRAVLPPCR